jgi:hypothetical protein
MRRLIIVTIFMSSFWGCVSYSSGVLTMGPDTFAVSVDSGRASQAEKKALQEAQNYCNSVGKKIVVTNTNLSSSYGTFNFNVTFRCLSPDDPEYVRPVYKKPADVEVEVKE